MKKTIGLFFAVLVCCPCPAQVRIEDLYEKAQANYPLIKQYGLIGKVEEYNLANAAKGYLPQVMFSAKATYQSEVTQIGIPGLNAPVLNKDQYGTTLDVNQSVWDGGAIRSQRGGIRTAAEVERKNVDVSIYAINERVNQLFFGILLFDAQIEQNTLFTDELRRNYDQVRSYMDNGVANQADVDAVRVEQLRAMQNRARLVTTKKAYVEMLSKLVGEELGGEFIKPAARRPAANGIIRPELALYDAQIRNLDAQNGAITSGLMPRLGLFVTGGYGNPGLNMLENKFSAYYIAGVKLTWNIGNFYTLKNSRRKIRANIGSVETQRETFLFNTGLDIIQKDNAIDSYLEQLKYDDEIIALRNSVKRASEAKMANGTLSATDLTRDINAEQMAIQDRIVHETELLLAIYNLRFATNN